MSGIVKTVARLIASTSLAIGCASKPTPPPIAGEPIGLQMLRVEPQLKQQRFNTLLDFESDSDVVFVAAEPAGAKVQARGGHTGAGSLALPKSTQSATVRLPLLVAGRAFPGDWTLAGAYLWSPDAVDVSVTYELEDQPLATRRVTLVADAWTPVMLDLSQIQNPNDAPRDGVGMLRFEFAEPTRAAVRLDDVVLIDNTRSLVGDISNSTGGPWSIRQRGFRVLCDQPGRFSFALATPEASANGWTVEEANELRARFSSTGEQKALTVYADGRAYWDGAYKPMSGQDAIHEIYRMQHDSPAEVFVPEQQGRLNRNTAGDANNDGYNELAGAYQIIASGSRLEIRLTPRTPVLVRPSLEIAGMPAGKALVTIEGQLVDRSTRLPDGTLLVELPVRIHRATTVHVRLQ